ncbi:MAG: ChbG/HpnK family deacetylase [Bacteroidales bacterium]|nr:ChbG/HpnK family deacetylase [Bacteroidales bacterium]
MVLFYKKYFGDWILNKINKKAIYDELKRQLDFFLSHGFIITHFDSHQNIHIIPEVFVIFEKLKTEYNLNIPTRFPYETLKFYNYKFSNFKRLVILNTLTSISKIRLSSVTPIKTIGGDFYNNNNPFKTFNFVLKNLNQNTVYEMAVHPGYYSETILKYDPYAKERETELNFLKMYTKKDFKSRVCILSFNQALQT